MGCEPSKAYNHIKNPWRTTKVFVIANGTANTTVVLSIPKYRRRTLFGVVRRELPSVFRRLAEQKQSRVEEGHILPDHVHMLLSIPPKLSVASVVGYIKGKSAIHVARHFLRRERNYAGQHLWARDYLVDTVGRDTERIRRYIQEQQAEDQRLDQLELPTGPNQER